MAVTVTPIAHRAKWAQQRTQYDPPNTCAPTPSACSSTQHKRSVLIHVEITRSSDLDGILAAAERHGRVLGVVE